MYQQDNKRETNLILRHCKTRVVNPPHTSTVTMTITRVVVKMSCLSSDWVFLMANANAMAPLRPVKSCYTNELF